MHGLITSFSNENITIGLLPETTTENCHQVVMIEHFTKWWPLYFYKLSASTQYWLLNNHNYRVVIFRDLFVHNRERLLHSINILVMERGAKQSAVANNLTWKINILTCMRDPASDPVHILGLILTSIPSPHSNIVFTQQATGLPQRSSTSPQKSTLMIKLKNTKHSL